MQTTTNKIVYVAASTEELLQALDNWLQAPPGVGLQIHVCGVTIDYPYGLTKRQFLSLVDYAYELVSDTGVH